MRLWRKLFGTEDPEDKGVTALIDALGNGYVRDQAFAGLAREGPSVVPRLIKVIKAEPKSFHIDYDWLVTGDESEGFKAGLREREILIREGVARVLGKIGDPRAIPYLERLAGSTNEHEMVREAAGRAIERIRETSGASSEIEDRVHSYSSEEWQLVIAYPVDWEIVRENAAAGSWTVVVAVAGEKTGGGRSGVIVNARRGEVLQGSSNVRVFSMQRGGAPREEPATPQEYIQRAKEDLQRAFSGFQYLSGHELRLADLPATSMVYTYDGANGRRQEKCVTVFGVGVTYQFICEAPASQFAAVAPIFDRILNSVRIGRVPS